MTPPLIDFVLRGAAWGTIVACPLAYAEAWHQLVIGEHAMTLAIAAIIAFAVFFCTYVIDHTASLPKGRLFR